MELFIILMKDHQVIMGITVFMETMLINIMQKNIFTKTMITKKMKNKLFIIFSIFLTSCVAPGMHMDTSKSWSNDYESVYIESIDKEIRIESISDFYKMSNKGLNSIYRIGNGDQISITVWGLPEIFPISNINPDQNLREGLIQMETYTFHMLASLKLLSKTQNELRESLSNSLSRIFFTDPQLDISIARFNS